MTKQVKTNGIRLNKYLSEAGICSRREADRIIQDGRVTVDGKKGEPGMRVFPSQQVKIGRKVIRKQEEFILLAVNKPPGIVCTEEKRERNSIIRFLKYPSRITYIGRLDKDSQGLLLMTNNGDMINKMMRAGNYHEKEYKVVVDKPVTESFIKGMSAGVPILTNPPGDAHSGVQGRCRTATAAGAGFAKQTPYHTITRPCKVTQDGKYTFTIILTQGLNRQIRRMCEHFGYQVKKLKRTRIMNIQLGKLKVGEYRHVTKSEIEILDGLIQHSSNNPKTRK